MPRAGWGGPVFCPRFVVRIVFFDLGTPSTAPRTAHGCGELHAPHPFDRASAPSRSRGGGFRGRRRPTRALARARHVPERQHASRIVRGCRDRARGGFRGSVSRGPGPGGRLPGVVQELFGEFHGLPVGTPQTPPRVGTFVRLWGVPTTWFKHQLKLDETKSKVGTQKEVGTPVFRFVSLFSIYFYPSSRSPSSTYDLTILSQHFSSALSFVATSGACSLTPSNNAGVSSAPAPAPSLFSKRVPR